LVLESGRKIEVPFDTLVIFATNFEPRSLMDEAGLRRLRHKILVDRPDRKTFVKILVRAAKSSGMALTEDTLAYIMLDLYGQHPNARFNAFHPRFLIEQCKSICSYQNIAPQLNPDILNRAWSNLMAAH
jgi:SpoVK/Ycf46/Vps4 family AAA+-type ATPase